MSASYEHKRFLLQLSEMLSKEDSKQIVYIEELPKELEEKAPWEVLAQLEVRGKSTTDELTRIFRDINRPDAAKKAKELMARTRKAPLTKKNSGSSSLKLEDSSNLTLKNSEVLREQMDYLICAAKTGGKLRIAELISEAKESLISQVQKKLKIASKLLSSENQENECVSVGLGSTSPTSSPESSLTMKSPELPVPQSPMRRPHAGLMFNDSDLRKGAEKLKPAKRQRGSSPQTLQQNSTRTPAGRNTDQTHNESSQKITAAVNIPPQSVQPEDACDDEGIYTLPGPINAVCQNSITNNVTYYNCPPLRDSQPLLQCLGNEKTLPVTGASNTRIKPVPAPKPKRGRPPTEKCDDSTSPADDYSITYSCSSSGDSGFSDSRAFRKDPPAPKLCQQAKISQPIHVTDPDSTYASLIKCQVNSADYYKSLKRENIPDIVYEEATTLST